MGQELSSQGQHKGRKEAEAHDDAEGNGDSERGVKFWRMVKSVIRW